MTAGGDRSIHPNSQRRTGSHGRALGSKTTEINNSFYRMPSLEAVRDWRRRTPVRFVFAWKGSKFITHWKRLNDSCANDRVDGITTEDPRGQGWTPCCSSCRQISRPIAGGSAFGACTLGSRPQAMFMCEVTGLTALS